MKNITKVKAKASTHRTLPHIHVNIKRTIYRYARKQPNTASNSGDSIKSITPSFVCTTLCSRLLLHETTSPFPKCLSLPFLKRKDAKSGKLLPDATNTHAETLSLSLWRRIHMIAFAFTHALTLTPLHNRLFFHIISWPRTIWLFFIHKLYTHITLHTSHRNSLPCFYNFNNIYHRFDALLPIIPLHSCDHIYTNYATQFGPKPPKTMEVSLPSSTVHRNSSTKLTGPDSSRDGAWRRARAPDISILRSSIIVTQVSFIQVGCHTPYDCISHSHTLLNLTYCLSPFSHGIPHFNKNMT